ncbi:SubName: Full=Related to RSC complex protein-Laccaria bicolor {ECO:0000313/EMBL:CCA69394.1} [Serendipita indica DSM 11827]|uniref:Related to RSC complex protein-Laccaria bicolor n=1 Tax=Serendipita indica (strain DSM 11827) TaxID=1109443 RepID=G4TDM2_SERID|nr:SubName: Full=Related to RSC complex protein-Laccaria bicolor {ECO:0000313/EMBL:CCA69394.1} [Serendipita indica DSM 11827]CCA69394.1 related to RSC complex protein-Laccaria bicolor [Serendipita indica DSM 11827]
MPIANAYKEAVQNIINKLNAEVTPTKPRRHLSTMFLDLPDPTTYGDYYTIITEPRSINGVQEKLQKNRYRNILDVLNDLYLTFANALHYNEASSQIAKDATVLQELFLKLWKDDPYLPNAQPTKQPGRKPGFRTAPLPRMSSFAPPMRHFNSIQPAYPTALATIQLKPIGKPPPPIIAPRLQPLPKRKRRKVVAKSEIEAPAASASLQTPRRPGSPAFSEVDLTHPYDGEENDPDIPQAHLANDMDTDLVLNRLEQSLPLWSPWHDDDPASRPGWMTVSNHEELQRRLETVVSILGAYNNGAENKPIAALENIPAQPEPKTTHSDALSWEVITSRVIQRHYLSSVQFEVDLFRLFEKARRHYKQFSPEYSSIMICQRLANLLTSPNYHQLLATPLTLPSLPAPQTAQPRKHIVDGIVVDNPTGSTSYDVQANGRMAMNSVFSKGIEYRVGDFVHLFNSEDMSHPLVGQIWACWTDGAHSTFTVCWYLHPDQTTHTPDHPFYENEVVKTGLYVDYSPEDIVEKVAVQFFPHYFTGRPRPPHWYPSWPLYMCEQRYDDRSRTFRRIAKPELCFPHALRKNGATSRSNSIIRAHLYQNPGLDVLQPIFPFERLVLPLRKSGPNAGPRRAASTGPTSFTIGPAEAKDVQMASASNGFDYGRGRPKRMAAVKAASAVGPPVPGSTTGSALSSTGNPAAGVTNTAPGDRTVISAAGGGIITSANVEKLTSETTHHFDRDPVTDEMLWFSGAPLDVAKPHGLHYSLDYLYEIALRQKRQAGVDGVEDSNVRRTRVVPPTASELWYQVSQGTSA